jgi:hypothetical protein
MPKDRRSPRRTARRPVDKTRASDPWRRLRPGFEALEGRTLLAQSFSLASVTRAYDQGVAAVGTATDSAAIVDQVLGVDSLPLAGQTLDQALGLATDFLRPFQTSLNQAATAWSSVAAQLQSAGFSIPVPFTGTPDANNNLLEVTWTQSLAPTDPIQVLGQTGFSYLDGAGSGGGLFGDLTATGSATVTISFGVDLGPNGQQPTFFVAPASNVVQASVTGSTASDALSGTLVIGDLASVSATASASVGFTGSLGLQATSADKDGKLRAGDLTANLSRAVTGGVQPERHRHLRLPDRHSGHRRLRRQRPRRVRRLRPGPERRRQVRLPRPPPDDPRERPDHLQHHILRQQRLGLRQRELDPGGGRLRRRRPRRLRPVHSSDHLDHHQRDQAGRHGGDRPDLHLRRPDRQVPRAGDDRRRDGERHPDDREL